MKNDKRQLTLTLSVVFSFFGPIVTGIAWMMNTSATQFADFIRRSAELSVLVLALYSYMRIKNLTLNPAKKHQFQFRMYRVSGFVLMFSSTLLLFLFIRALVYPSIPEGNVILGLATAGLGLLFNTYFWLRYSKFNQEKASAIMDSQGSIYQAKTFADLNVVIALTSVLVFASSWLSYWIDTFGTLLLALYLAIRGYSLFRKKDVESD